MLFHKDSSLPDTSPGLNQSGVKSSIHDLPNNFNPITKKVMIDLNNQLNSNNSRKYNAVKRSLSPGHSR